MRRIQVVTQKELVKPELLTRSVVVVIDVFLATSSIIFLLKKGYEPVYPAFDSNHAWSIFEKLEKKALLFGEENGELIDGFTYPDVSNVKVADKQSNAIICSTNGTRAIEMSRESNVLLLSSLINGHRVAEYIRQETERRSVVIVSAGNAGHFSIEDMVGAGQLVDHLLQNGNYSVSDSAKTAQSMFNISKGNQFQDLLQSETADLLERTGYKNSMIEVLEQIEKVNILPFYQEGKVRSLTKERIN